MTPGPALRWLDGPTGSCGAVHLFIKGIHWTRKLRVSVALSVSSDQSESARGLRVAGFATLEGRCADEAPHLSGLIVPLNPASSNAQKHAGWRRHGLSLRYVMLKDPFLRPQALSTFPWPIPTVSQWGQRSLPLGFQLSATTTVSHFLARPHRPTRAFRIALTCWSTTEEEPSVNLIGR